MAFPFTYNGLLRFKSDILPEVDEIEGKFFEKAKQKLLVAKARVDLNEQTLSFSTTLKAFPYWFNRDAGYLANIPRGTIYLEQGDQKIHYILNFKKSVTIYSIGTIGFFGSFFIFVVKGPLPTRVAIVFFAWLIMMLAMYVGGVLGFKQFLKRLLQEM